MSSYLKGGWDTLRLRLRRRRGGGGMNDGERGDGAAVHHVGAAWDWSLAASTICDVACSVRLLPSPQPGLDPWQWSLLALAEGEMAS